MCKFGDLICYGHAAPTAAPLSSVESERFLAFDSGLRWLATPVVFGLVRAGSVPMNYFIITSA